MRLPTHRFLLTAFAAASLVAAAAHAAPPAADPAEATIRQTLPKRLPSFPKIDEVRKLPNAGLYEVRVGTDIFYTDAAANYLIEGHALDTKRGINITEERVNKLTAIDVAALPLKDAIVWKQGTGARKLVVFADPNCGYCKRFERDLQGVKDVTVYTFLIPILGGDSPEKSRNIWCAADSTKAWRDWMIDGVTPPKAMGQCDTAALQRNVALGAKHRINGTPALVFEDGKRVPGALNTEQLERQLAESTRKPG